jgi:O-antigen/teichoic acid export membrane protein
MEIYSHKRARRSVFDVVGYRAISQLATALSYVVLVRGMSEQAFGVFNLLYSVVPIILTVASLGLEWVLRRFLPEFLRAGNLAAAAWLVRSATTARFISSAVLLAAFYAAWPIIAPIIHLDGHRTDFVWFSGLALLYFQVSLLQLSLAAYMLHRYSAGSSAVLALAKLAAYGLLLHFGGLSLRGAICADASAYALCYAFLYTTYRRNCLPKQTAAAWRPNSVDRTRLRRFALTNNFNDAGSLMLYVQTDNFFIAALLGPVAVGAYSFYTRLNEMTQNLIPSRVFENVVQPLFYSVPRAEAAWRLPRYFSFLVDVNLLMQLPLIAYASLYHHEIVQLIFGGKFLDYSALLPLIVAFGFTNNVISMPVTMIAQYVEKSSVVLVSQVFGLYQIVAMLTLIPVLGLYGAAIATGTLHLFRNGFVWWFVRDQARWHNAAAVLGSGTLIWGTAIAVCFGLKRLTGLPAEAQLACGLLVCGLATLIYVRSPAISVSDREILGRVLHGREAGILRWAGILRREPAQ